MAAKRIKRPSLYSLAGMKEVSVLTRLSSGNCIKCEGIAVDDAYVYIICEYLSNGSLVEYLRSRGKQKIKRKEQLKMAVDVCRGMTYLESLKFVHRDLAARNILLDHDLNAKIADFGHCREEDSNDGPGKMPVKWTAPEAIKSNKFTSKSDVWSYGVLLWEIYSYGRLPYLGICVKNVYETVCDGYRLKCPEDCPKEIYSLMEEMWLEDPRRRPSFVEISRRLHQIY